jgi:hypothetical protein
MTTDRWAWAALVLSWACGQSPPKGTEVPTDADTETDTVADTDTDIDTDTDTDIDTGETTAGVDSGTDTGLGPPSLVTGEWAGYCTSLTSTYLNFVYLHMVLTESGGAVSGQGNLSVSQSGYGGTTGGGTGTIPTYTFTLPIVLTGIFDGVSAIDLLIGQDYGTYVTPTGLAVDGTITGTSWAGSLYSVGYSSYAPIDCVLDLQ